MLCRSSSSSFLFVYLFILLLLSPPIWRKSVEMMRHGEMGPAMMGNVAMHAGNPILLFPLCMRENLEEDLRGSYVYMYVCM